MLVAVLFSLRAFAGSEEVRVYTPQDTVAVKELGAELEVRVTREWVQFQANQNPETHYFWRTSPTSLEKILADAEFKENVEENLETEPPARASSRSHDLQILNRYNRSGYVPRPKPKKDIIVITEGEWIPRYDRRSGEMKYVRANRTTVEEMAGKNSYFQYAFRPAPLAPASNSDRERYSNGEPADQYSRDEYRRLEEQGYGTRYRMPIREAVEHNASAARRAAEEKSHENLWGKPLKSLPNR